MVDVRPWAARLVLVLALAPVPFWIRAPDAAAAAAGDDCLSCHQGIEAAGAGHDLACPVCHLPLAGRKASSADHGNVIPNPSQPQYCRAQCGPCHAREVEAVEACLHATLAGIINQTRYLWGAQPAAEPPAFSANSHLRPLPDPLPRPRTTAMLVDSFLRSRCLGCHIGTRGPGGPGLYRGEGCAACHADYAADGLYRGGDRAVDRGRPGRPVRHGLSGATDEARCLRCHCGNHVGGDFHGLFERDSAPMFQQALSWGRPMPTGPGSAHHVLAADVHAEQGMTCLDCHTGAQVMGLAPGAGPSCQGCHGDRDGSGPDLSLPGVAAKKGGFVFCRRDKQAVPLPLVAPGTPGHDPELHGRVACFTCHAQWTFGDYGLSVLRRDGEARGAWQTDYRFRRWEDLALGVDRKGRIAPLRPRHQYLVSYVDRLGGTILDSVVPIRGDGQGPGWAFSPYAPHTTAPQGRSCQECHGNPEAAGLGVDWAQPPDMTLLRASPPVPGDGRLLNALERRCLLEPGRPFQKAFAAYLLGMMEGR